MTNEVIDQETAEAQMVEVVQPAIEKLIYVIRDKQVMIDSDLAMLYHVETKRLNEAVKRNIARFPEEFRFQLTEKETESLRSQIATSMKSNGDNEKKGGRRYLPYAFTEQGIAMLSAVLRSDVAIQVSINIMNAFVEMRRFIANNALLFERISTVELKQLEYQKKTDEKLEQIFEYIADHEESNQKVFHDRFLILDRKTAYHIGASLKDAGKKCFGINLIEDAGIIRDILQRLELETEE